MRYEYAKIVEVNITCILMVKVQAIELLSIWWLKVRILDKNINQVCKETKEIES